MGVSIAPARRSVMDESLKDLPDEALVRCVKKDHAEAYSELVRRHQHTVYRLALRYMRDPAASEDMAQEAFLKGYRLFKGFRGDCSFSTWMYRVTSSVCLTELARRRKRGEVPLEGRPEDGYEDDRAEKRDRAAIIRACVTRLPEHYATIVTMYYFNQTSYDEIAAAMKIPVGTLKTWMFRARKELRTLVEQELGDDDLAV